MGCATLLALATPAQAGDGSGDGSMSTDASAHRDAGTGGGHDAMGDGGSPPVTFVIKRLAFPTDRQGGRRCGFRRTLSVNAFTVSNWLGWLLGELLYSPNKATSFQPQLDRFTCSGQKPQILRFETISTEEGRPLSAELRLAKPEQCCTSADASACCAEADKACFDGTKSFDALSNGGMGQFKGAVGKDGFELRATVATLRFALYKTEIAVPLMPAVVTGAFWSGGVTDGCIAGFVRARDMRDSFLPALAQALDTILVDPTASSSAKAVAGLFDSDGNGRISVKCDLDGNPLFNGDFDIDGDGQRDHSFGIAYSAAKARFGGLTGPADGGVDSGTAPADRGSSPCGDLDPGANGSEVGPSCASCGVAGGRDGVLPGVGCAVLVLFVLRVARRTGASGTRADSPDHGEC